MDRLCSCRCGCCRCICQVIEALLWLPLLVLAVLARLLLTPVVEMHVVSKPFGRVLLFTPDAILLQWAHENATEVTADASTPADVLLCCKPDAPAANRVALQLGIPVVVVPNN